MSYLRLLLVATFVAAVSSTAQAQLPVVAISADLTTLHFAHNDTAQKVVTWRIANGGTLAANVALALDPADGWDVTLSQSSVSVPGQQSTTVTSVVKPKTASPANATLVLKGTVTDQANQPRGSATPASVGLRFQPAPPAPVIPPPPKSYVWHITAGIASAVLLVGYVAQAGQVGFRIRERVIRGNIGTDALGFIGVASHSPFSTRVQLRIRGLPGPYVAAFSSPEVRLGARETLQVPLLIRIPVTAPAGEKVRFQIQARPNGFSPWIARNEIELQTLDVKVDS